jgi:hypothetical protein
MPLVRMNTNAVCPDFVFCAGKVYNVSRDVIKRHKLLEKHPTEKEYPIPATIITQADLKKGERVQQYEFGRPDPEDRLDSSQDAETEDLLETETDE